MSTNRNGSHILHLDNDTMFNDFALRVLDEQLTLNPVYAGFFRLLGKKREQISDWKQIPCLPIEAFRRHKVILEGYSAEFIFRSSGTTDAEKSEHHVSSLDWYRQVALTGFKREYGDLKDWSFMSLLPSYSERPDSSLIYMIRSFMDASGHDEHGFYLHDYQRLQTDLRIFAEKRKVMLFGVTFALLQMAEKSPFKLENTTIMETGGMKGKGPELTRMEVHTKLRSSFGVPNIHSEYGMTELLSQAYSHGDGMFLPPPWMRVVVREVTDPLSSAGVGVTGGLNIIDLANVYSCPFIATGDLGRVCHDGHFEVLGRYDHAEARGCNLMVSQLH